MPRTAYLALGSNLGDRLAYLRDAVARLRAAEGVEVLRLSRVYETDPIGITAQPPFLNMVLEAGIPDSLPARDLLRLVKRIEADLGRQGRECWGPREIDIDVLLIGEERVNDPDFQLPHPRMWERAFVVVPLADLVPEMMAPGGQRVVELAQRLRQEQGIHAHLSL